MSEEKGVIEQFKARIDAHPEVKAAREAFAAACGTSREPAMQKAYSEARVEVAKRLRAADKRKKGGES